LLLVGCGGGSGGKPSPATGKGNLHGTVTRAPTSPVCRSGTPCSAPAAGAQLLFTLLDDGPVTSVVVAKDGSYSVSLAPGVYTVTVSPQSIGPGIEPGKVRVAAGQARNVDFRIDTGIR
jgi:hypothetical protein